MDALVYSQITGIRVKILVRSERGLVCSQDTLELSQSLADLETGDGPLPIAVTAASPTQVLLHHGLGQADEAGQENDHYGALITEPAHNSDTSFQEGDTETTPTNHP